MTCCNLVSRFSRRQQFIMHDSFPVPWDAFLSVRLGLATDFKAYFFNFHLRIVVTCDFSLSLIDCLMARFRCVSVTFADENTFKWGFCANSCGTQAPRFSCSQLSFNGLPLFDVILCFHILYYMYNCINTKNGFTFLVFTGTPVPNTAPITPENLAPPSLRIRKIIPLSLGVSRHLKLF